MKEGRAFWPSLFGACSLLAVTLAHRARVPTGVICCRLGRQHPGEIRVRTVRAGRERRVVAGDPFAGRPNAVADSGRAPDPLPVTVEEATPPDRVVLPQDRARGG